MSDALPRACTSEEDPQITQVRKRLETYLRPLRAAPACPWGFAIYPRRQPVALAPRVIGIVTMTESAALTGALIRQLPTCIWLERAPGPIEMISVSGEPELLHEALPMVLLRFIDGELSGTKLLSAHELPRLGIVFVTDRDAPPHGWPP